MLQVEAGTRTKHVQAWRTKVSLDMVLSCHEAFAIVTRMDELKHASVDLWTDVQVGAPCKQLPCFLHLF